MLSFIGSPSYEVVFVLYVYTKTQVLQEEQEETTAFIFFLI